MMMRVVSALVGFALMAACGQHSKGASDSAAGAAVTGRIAAAENQPGASKALAAPAENLVPAGNAGRLGRIPIFEYHVIGDSNSGMFTVSREQFRRDLQTLYDRGYRPITVAQLLDKDFSDVPT